MSTPPCSPSHRYIALVPRGLQHTICENLVSSCGAFSVAVVADPPVPSNAALRETFRVTRSKDDAKGRNRRRYECLEGGTTESDAMVGPIPNGRSNNGNRMVGYFNSHPTDKNHDGAVRTKTIVCEAGLLGGIVWVSFETTTARNMVRTIGIETRCIGPLMAMIQQVTVDFPSPTVSLSQAVECIHTSIDLPTYTAHFEDAFRLWREHVQHCWQETVGATAVSPHLWNNEKTTSLKYRLSFVRSTDGGETNHPYTRVELLSSEVASLLVPEHYRVSWTVDLKHYDIEIVLLQRDQHLVIGFTLRPYRLCGITSFSQGGLPGDITPPIVRHTSEVEVVRLKAPTAQTLLLQANIQPGDVVLDPCCGIGTIPYEASLMGAVVAMGGDLVLGPQQVALRSVALPYLQQRRKRVECMAIDASCVPLRSQCIDVVVSDLPFGHHCLSSSGLDQFLPLLLAEMGRLLRVNTGRLVLLCGSYVPILEAMRKQDGVWNLPCQSVFPVSIGGHVAWVITCTRGHSVSQREPNHIEKVRKLTRKRETIEKQQMSLPDTAKRRRAQA